MIQITVGDGFIAIEGHANYAEKGKDIVCAGISAIHQTAILGFEAIAREHPQYVKFIDERDN